MEQCTLFVRCISNVIAFDKDNNDNDVNNGDVKGDDDNETIGNVIEIVYQDIPVGPNGKQHYHLPALHCDRYPTPEITLQHSTMGQPTQNSEYSIYS